MRFIPVFVILFFFACKKSNEPKAIVLSSKEVTILSGAQADVTIAGDVKAYRVSSANEAVATATVQDNRITITADKLGATTIHVEDGNDLTAAITVRSSVPFGNWRRTPEAMFDPTVLVECADPAFAAQLKQQIIDDLAKPANMITGFQFVSYPSQIVREVRADNTRKDGAFTYEKLIVRLTFDGVEVVHRIVLRPDKLRQLEQDVTEKYKALYPDKGITRVMIARLFREHQNPG